jgi:DNA polymerase-3 subunit alpha
MNKAKEGLELRLRKFIYKKNINKSQHEIKIIYQDRLSHELDIINSMNYSSYFLIVSDYIKWAKKILYPLVLEEDLEQVL